MQEDDVVLLFGWVLAWLEITPSFLGSITECTSALGEAEELDVLLLSLVSKRSIIRDTVAIPALTSLLTSEPISATELFRENSRSLHPRVLLTMDSLYLIARCKGHNQHLQWYWKQQINIKIPHWDRIQARFQRFWEGL